MKTFFCLVVLAVSVLCQTRAELAQVATSGYSITASPTNLVIGEEFVVKWTVPIGTFTIDDWLGIFLLEASNRNPVMWKLAAFRGGKTVFNAPEKNGNYHCRYFEWNFRGGSRHVATSETLYVRLPVENPFAIKNYPPRGRTIIVFGDSLVAGKGVAPGDNFPAELSRRLDKAIINAGVIGNTTDEALARLQTDVLDKNPKIVIMLLGGNDILEGKSPVKAVENLKAIILRVHETGACVILVGVQGGLFTDRLRDGLHKLAEETKVSYVPNILRGIIGNPLRLSDAVHPNKRGYKLMADRIFPALAALDKIPKPVPLFITQDDGTVTLRWTGLPEKEYRIVTSTNLTISAFELLTVATTMDEKGCSVSFPATSSAQFFRVEEVTPVGE